MGQDFWGNGSGVRAKETSDLNSYLLGDEGRHRLVVERGERPQWKVGEVGEGAAEPQQGVCGLRSVGLRSVQQVNRNGDGSNHGGDPSLPRGKPARRRTAGRGRAVGRTPRAAHTPGPEDKPRRAECIALEETLRPLAEPEGAEVATRIGRPPTTRHAPMRRNPCRLRALLHRSEVVYS